MMSRRVVFTGLGAMSPNGSEKINFGKIPVTESAAYAASAVLILRDWSARSRDKCRILIRVNISRKPI